MIRQFSITEIRISGSSQTDLELLQQSRSLVDLLTSAFSLHDQRICLSICNTQLATNDVNIAYKLFFGKY